jgi:hypothetical protein
MKHYSKENYKIFLRMREVTRHQRWKLEALDATVKWWLIRERFMCSTSITHNLWSLLSEVAYSEEES